MKITVAKPFSYYIDGYKKMNFERGDYEVPEDCMNYAVQNGFLILDNKDKETGGNVDRAGNARRGKGTMPN